MKKNLLLFLLVVIFSCTNDPKKQLTGEPSFSLETFTSIPDDMEGCGCYFYLSKEDEANEQFVFMNNFADVAYVFIDGKLCKFQLIRKEKNDVYFYSNKAYQLKVTIKGKEDVGPEQTLITGTIELSKEGNTVEKDFTGNCGC